MTFQTTYYTNYYLKQQNNKTLSQPSDHIQNADAPYLCNKFKRKIPASTSVHIILTFHSFSKDLDPKRKKN